MSGWDGYCVRVRVDGCVFYLLSELALHNMYVPVAASETEIKYLCFSCQDWPRSW